MNIDADSNHLSCYLCNGPVEVRTGSTIGDGEAVHEPCYLAYIHSRMQIMIGNQLALATIRRYNLHKDEFLIRTGEENFVHAGSAQPS